MIIILKMLRNSKIYIERDVILVVKNVLTKLRQCAIMEDRVRICTLVDLVNFAGLTQLFSFLMNEKS